MLKILLKQSYLTIIFYLTLVERTAADTGTGLYAGWNCSDARIIYLTFIMLIVTALNLFKAAQNNNKRQLKTRLRAKLDYAGEKW